MLVLTRRLYEIIEIGDDITITVVDILDDKVRLGITAPRDLPVHRREIANRIRLERMEQLTKKPPLEIRTDTKEGSD